jgi:hypothetical protein
MIQLDPELGYVNNLQLLTQKLKFRLVESTKPFQQQQQRPKQQQQQLENFIFDKIFHLIVSSVNDFYGVELEHPDFLKSIFLEFQKNILMIE